MWTLEQWKKLGNQQYCGDIYGGLTSFEIIALTMTDVPKKNKKGKRVA